LHRRPLSWEKDAPADGGALLALFLSSISSFFVSSPISGGHGKLYDVQTAGFRPSVFTVSTGKTAERFYPDFENEILATRGEGLGANCGPLLGCLLLNCRLSETERKTY